MQAISGKESCSGSGKSDFMSKMHGAATAISTHTLAAIGIVVDHFEIVLLMMADKYEAICAYAKMAVAELPNQCSASRKLEIPVVYYNEIVTCAVVFIKSEMHNKTDSK